MIHRSPSVTLVSSTTILFAIVVALSLSVVAEAPNYYVVEFHTTVKTGDGIFRIEVFRDWAPLGADRFYELVKAKYYDKNGFFRIVNGFVVQWGINGVPTVSAEWKERKIDDDPTTHSNKLGTIAFASSGANTRTTQIFINLGSNTNLDAGFAPFGRVLSGMNVVKGIYSGYHQDPDQSQILRKGNAYLETNFPKLDYTKAVRVIQEGEAPNGSAAPSSTKSNTWAIVLGSVLGSVLLLVAVAAVVIIGVLSYRKFKARYLQSRFQPPDDVTLAPADKAPTLDFLDDDAADDGDGASK